MRRSRLRARERRRRVRREAVGSLARRREASGRTRFAQRGGDPGRLPLPLRASFQEMHRLLERGVIGTVHNFGVAASGPAVLRPSGRTWRSKSSAGGGCLYDYASHAVNLATFLFGQPTEVGGAVLGRVFSAAVEDEVYATLYYPTSLTGQLSANWSDGSQRKMSMRVDAWGSTAESGRPSGVSGVPPRWRGA